MIPGIDSGSVTFTNACHGLQPRSAGETGRPERRARQARRVLSAPSARPERPERPEPKAQQVRPVLSAQSAQPERPERPERWARQEQSALIKHEKIDDWMEAMTMDFPIKDKAEFDQFMAERRARPPMHDQPDQG